jgi:hypothetical protein
VFSGEYYWILSKKKKKKEKKVNMIGIEWKR